jgi:hypothetical protein
MYLSSQMPSVFGSHKFHPQSDGGPCRGEWEGSHFTRPVTLTLGK